MDGYCYDSQLLLKFKKEIFYEIYKPSNISKTTIEEYKKNCVSNEQFYDDIVNTNISDFQPNGRKRIDLCVTIPLIQGIASAGNDEDFKKDLKNYLDLIQYDEKQVYEEMNMAFQKCLEKVV